jgi:hypothetical protein
MKNVDHYGTHSVRKGVATFACSGTTGGPSIASVCLRVGWSLGGVQDRYIRYECAGDQYLDRVVAGLPLNSAKFACLPPHFINNNDERVCAAVSKMFPALYGVINLQDILKLCLASLVYHSQYLAEILPSDHQLNFTYITRNPDQMNHLGQQLASDSSTWMIPTGIPPHIELYQKIDKLQNSVDELRPSLLEGMGSLLEEKGIAAGNITKDVLEDTIKRVLTQVGLNRPVSSATDINLQRHDGVGDTVHYYNGKFHLLPQSFSFPRVTAFEAWKLW